MDIVKEYMRLRLKYTQFVILGLTHGKQRGLHWIRLQIESQSGLISRHGQFHTCKKIKGFQLTALKSWRYNVRWWIVLSSCGRRDWTNLVERSSIPWNKNDGQAISSVAWLLQEAMTTQTLKLPQKRRTWTSQPTSRYNHNEYRAASGLQVVLNSVWSRYEGDIHDIRHPCGDRFWTISELAW